MHNGLLAALVAFPLALPLHADTLTDLRNAVAALRGAVPIRATAELHRTENHEGRFANEKFTGAATVEMTIDGDGVHVTFPKPLLDQFLKEAHEQRADPKKVSPTQRTAGALSPLWVIQRLNAADTFLGLLHDAKLVSETRVAWQNRPARLLIFDRKNDLSQLKGIGNADIKMNRLRIWVGDDNLPLAADHNREGTIRVLLFHGKLNESESWQFARVADHLVITRYDSSDYGDLLGQKSDEKRLEIVRPALATP